MGWGHGVTHDESSRMNHRPCALGRAAALFDLAPHTSSFGSTCFLLPSFPAIMKCIIDTLVAALLLVPFSLAFVAGPQCRASFRTTSRLQSSALTELPDGLIKTISKPGSGIPLKLGDIASVKYSCYLPNQDAPPFAKSDFQKVVSTGGCLVCLCRRADTSL
jgi:hypothetical protein